MAFRAIPVAAGLALAAALCAPWAVAQGAPPSTPPQLPGGAATTPTPAMAMPAEGNTALTGTIIQRLSNDPVLGSQTITASVGTGGVVTLDGVVPQQKYADRAIQVVKSVAGVEQVNNQILVNQDPFATPPPEGNASQPLTASVPEVPAAQDPQAQIADALAKVPALADVSAQMYGNQIVLYGSVKNDEAKKQAEQVVRSISPNQPLIDIIWKDTHPMAPPPMVPKSS